MSFKINEKEYSDSEVAKAYKQIMAERHQWCIDEARKYFESKKITKRYRVDLYHPDVEDTFYYVLNDNEIKEYRDFIEKNRKQYLIDFPEDPNYEDGWEDYLRDSFCQADFLQSYFVEEYEDFAQVTYVDLDDFLNTYRFDIRYFNNDNMDEPHDDFVGIDLSDEQYINLVAACLEDKNLSTDRLYFDHPDIYKEIAEVCFKRGKECAIFLTEAKQDAENILKAVGNQMPKKPEGPFAAIAAMLASK